MDKAYGKNDVIQKCLSDREILMANSKFIQITVPVTELERYPMDL